VVTNISATKSANPIAQYAVSSDATNRAVITKTTALEIGPKRDIKAEDARLNMNP
jgi:hypothetical protein